MRTPALTLPVSVQREEAVSNALEELKLQVASLSLLPFNMLKWQHEQQKRLRAGT